MAADRMTAAERDRVQVVFQEHHRLIEAVAGQHAISREHVPDIVQTVALRLCTYGLNGFRAESSIKTYLYRITVNEARRHFRREEAFHKTVQQQDDHTKAGPDAGQDGSSYTPTLEDDLDSSERADALREAITQLPRSQRQAILSELAEGNGSKRPRVKMSSRVIGRTRSYRWKARQRLRRLLADDPRLAE